MSATERLTQVVTQVGDIADSVKAKLSYFLAIGLIASLTLA
ncbi:MAG: hypothetical protein ACJAQ6_001672 [Arenicella sp.]|jgi:hypothetical protein